jgi:small subunit ribosomal protein S16
MVTIRLSRFGRKNAAFYRIAVMDGRKKTVGGAIEYIGTWNPVKKLKEIDKKKLDEWVKKGAQVSPAVKKLVEK